MELLLLDLDKIVKRGGCLDITHLRGCIVYVGDKSGPLEIRSLSPSNFTNV
jgi:hypothetical protein